MILRSRYCGLIIGILIFGVGPSTAEAQEVLELDRVVTRELAGGETHIYQISVTSGQYVRVTVEAPRLRVVFSMFDPDGKKAAENSAGTYIPWGASTIARMSGSYRIEVTSPDAPKTKGSYSINVEELRAATLEDEYRVAAERALIEGRRLAPKRLAKFCEALDLWRRAGDRRGEAETLWFLGNANRSMGQPEKARDYYNQSLALALEIDYRRVEGPLYNALGQLSAESGDWQAALDAYDRALEAAEHAGNRAVESYVLESLAHAYEDLDDFQTALSYFEERLAIARSEGDRRGEFFWLKDTGRMRDALGEKQAAAEQFERAAALARDFGDRPSEARLYLLIGNHFLEAAKDYQRALDFYNRALLISRADNDRVTQAGTLSNMATAYLAMREKQKTLDSFDQVLLLWRALGKSERGNEAYALNNIGKAYYEYGELQRALVFEEQALDMHRELGNRMGVNRSLDEMARIYAALGDTQKAISLTEPLLKFARDTDDRIMEAETLGKLALLERGRDNLVEARRIIESAIQIAESTRATFTSPDLRSKYFISAKTYYELYIDVLMQLHQKHPAGGFDTVALQVSESARARSLLDLLVEARADIRKGAVPELIERERLLQHRLNDKAREQRELLAGKHTSAQADAIESEIRAVLKDYAELDAKIRATCPAYASLTRPALFGLREIQQQVLDPDTILLEYALGSERSYLWLVTPDSVASYPLPKRKDIESVSRRVSEELTARQPLPSETEKQYLARVSAADAQYPKDVAALSEILLGKIKSRLGKKRLLIVADGALQYIPFATLSLPGSDHPLIVDHEIVNLPSASVLATLRRDTAHRAPADKAVAVIADPVFDATDPRVKAMQRDHTQKNGERSKGIDLQRALRGFDLGRLPYSRREADAILAAAPAGAVTELVDFDANRELAIGGELSRYRTVHFATHALLNGEHPELSGIVLSLVDKEGRSRDGYVRLHDIYNLNLSAELVVLSACKTALGKEIRGEGLIGLTRGFMYAGTKRVVASLWKVDDWRTAELMKRFYMKMLVDKKSPAAALQAAQIEMWRQPKWRAPYYWAGFTLQGEPK